MKPGKFFVVGFCSLRWGVARAQNLAKYDRLQVFMQLTNRNIAIT